MWQKPYIKMRSRTSLWAEHAKTSRMATMATRWCNTEQPNTIVHEFVHVDKVCCTIICLMFVFERRKTIRAFTELIRWSFDSVFPRNRSDDHVIPYFYGIGPMSIFWPSVKREEFNGAIDFAHSGLLAEVTFWVRVRAQIVPTNESDAAWISKLDSWRVTCYMLSERTLYHRTTTTETRIVQVKLRMDKTVFDQNYDSERVTCYMLPEKTLYHRNKTTETRIVYVSKASYRERRVRHAAVMHCKIMKVGG